MLDGTTRTIKADREEVLGALRANREKHIAEFRDAALVWAKVALKRVCRKQDVLVHLLENESTPIEQLPSLYFQEEHEKPALHTKEYDRAIRMLELHQESTIELTAKDVEQYIMDEWSWTENFKNISAT